MTAEGSVYILFPGEAEAMVQGLEMVSYEEYGLERWYNYHSYLTKLNMQVSAQPMTVMAINSAQTQGDEFVKEYLVTHQKLDMLVADLVAIELWKEKVFSSFLRDQIEPSSSFPIYTLLYHELLVANLLETVTFHADAMETLNDAAVDLSDWCYRALCYLVAEFPSEEKKREFISMKDKVLDNNLGDLERQNRVISFDKGMKAVSLVRHLIDHSLSANSVLPLGVARRLLQTNDVVLVLCQLLEQAPWTAIGLDEETGKPQRLLWQESGTWIAEDKVKTPVGKTEGQIWLCLYQILLANHSSLRYDCSVGHRRAALLRIRSYLTEVKLDVLPVLIDLRRFLEQLSLSDNPGGASNTSGVAEVCLVELVPEIREALCKKYAKKWKQTCRTFRELIESERGRQASRRAATQWSDTFSEQHMEKLFASMGDGVLDGTANPLGNAPKCVVCGADAPKRCSRCRQEWYCRRECQVKHWPKHKKACDLLYNSEKA
ncbi:hypothetical protein T265_13539 [Opisthorchis viverrini]|uniref:Zinc finger MYND domain-containing protein 10 n=1 Tax=Opisthorchis viverrini TaxID=6198 RepID=A0A074ZMJ8_OPIVI|nr:hypothetical protein T265_13539 [Opisthorchis viverrini]KER28608.1 hypothetical protein T265_13539 [Opisthorchis viverrini]